MRTQGEMKMSDNMTTMKAVVEAIQDAARSDDEAVAALTHLLNQRGAILAQSRRAAVQVAKAYF